MTELLDLPDPRRWPPGGSATAQSAALHRLVQQRLALEQSAAAERADAEIDAALRDWLGSGEGPALAGAFASAPAADVYRHLWRRLAVAEVSALTASGLAAMLVALPMVVVAARASAGDPVTLTDALADAPALGDLLREHRAIAADARIALSSALVAADALDLVALPGLIAAGRSMLAGAPPAPLSLAASAVRVEGTQEAAHLRFLVGVTLCAPDADPLRASAAAGGMALARALSRALAVRDATVLVMPGLVERLVPALVAGRAAQRQVALDLFAGNAVRRLRAGFGEPSAVISAHAADDAPGGGELRLSLSSPFAPRDAEGFRYPLQLHERVPDAVSAIATLLRDCRVSDVRAMPGVQPDRDPATGLLRFCRPEDVERTLH